LHEEVPTLLSALQIRRAWPTPPSTAPRPASPSSSFRDCRSPAAQWPPSPVSSGPGAWRDRPDSARTPSGHPPFFCELRPPGASPPVDLPGWAPSEPQYPKASSPCIYRQLNANVSHPRRKGSPLQAGKQRNRGEEVARHPSHASLDITLSIIERDPKRLILLIHP